MMVSKSLNSFIKVGAFPPMNKFLSLSGTDGPIVLSGIVLNIIAPSSAYPTLASNGLSSLIL